MLPRSNSSSVNNGLRTRTGGNRNRPNNPPAQPFYPKLIFAQIVSLQCFHYFLLAFFFQVNHVLYGTTVTIDRIFTDRYLRLWQSERSGWADAIALFLASLVGYVSQHRRETRGFSVV
jgi:hypothetical protein